MDATRPGGSSLPISRDTRGPWLGWAMSAPSTSAAAALAASVCSDRSAAAASPPGHGHLHHSSNNNKHRQGTHKSSLLSLACMPHLACWHGRTQSRTGQQASLYSSSCCHVPSPASVQQHRHEHHCSALIAAHRRSQW
jgi:hypothetical protein